MTTVSNCVGSERLADLSDPSLQAGYQRFLVDPFAYARKDIGPLQNEVAAARNAHESFRLVGECEQSPGGAYRNDVVHPNELFAREQRRVALSRWANTTDFGVVLTLWAPA
jgi:hypothetical protein